MAGAGTLDACHDVRVQLLLTEISIRRRYISTPTLSSTSDSTMALLRSYRWFLSLLPHPNVVDLQLHTYIPTVLLVIPKGFS